MNVAAMRMCWREDAADGAQGSQMINKNMAFEDSRSRQQVIGSW